MGVRITNNIIMTMLTFYTRYVIVVSNVDISKKIPFQLALLPLIMYVFSVAGSSSINWIVSKTSRKITYAFGAIMVFISSIILFIINHEY